MISLLINSRIEGNPNWGLPNLLNGFSEMSSSYDNFEVLVKFDSDDRLVPEFIKSLDKYPFTIKHLIEPRGRGYIDIHIGYTRVMSLADPCSTVMAAFADDFIITENGWDDIVLKKTAQFDDDLYIIHQRPHPPQYRPDIADQPFYPHFSLDHLDTIEIIDEGPFWSRRLLEICGGLGHVSFTDAWTLCLQWYLYHEHGINRSLFLDEPVIHRRLHEEVDTIQSERWHSDRKWNFEFIASDFYRTMVRNQADNIALHLANNDCPLPNKKITDSSNENIEKILFEVAVGAIRWGNLKSAVREFELIVDRFPNNQKARHLLGMLYVRTKDYNLAAPHLECILSSAPDTPEIRNQLGVAIAEAGNLRKALKLFREELEHNPINKKARKNLEVVEEKLRTPTSKALAV